MKELVVISGKGGTGKTSVLASFAALSTEHVLVDADVDAADLHLILSPNVVCEKDFKGGHMALIDPDTCTECGECIERCQFDAINADFVVNRYDCEGCGVCVYFCPEQAIEFPQKTCGKLYWSGTRHGPMVHAKLGVAEENSGLLVSRVRREAKELAEDRSFDTILVDGPPGIGCPVIACLTGTGAILIVTEPTLSGLHDLQRVGELAAHFKIQAFACINKFDLNEEVTDRIVKYCNKNHIEMLGCIPYDTTVTKAMVEGKSIVEYTDCKASAAIKDIWKKVDRILADRSEE
jgi:MinD superfamily P-loop ATPase